MIETRKIEIYKQVASFVSPIDGGRDNMYNSLVSISEVGDCIVIIDGIVWVKHYSKEAQDVYAPAIYSAEFVRMNCPLLFQKL